MITTGELPILKHREEILESVIDHQVTVVIGETGSGKTTQIPQFLFELGSGLSGKIGVTQPRRVAATSVAYFVSRQLGCDIGQEVGYKIRFDDNTTEGTAIKFMTDGILLREMQSDPMLSEYSVIMVDEAHERSLNMDFLLGLLKGLLKKRSDLRLIVSSATIEEVKFSRYFSGAPVINVSGRTHPVDIKYCAGSGNLFPNTRDQTVELVEQIHRSTETGDILIFLDGEGAINGMIEEIERKQLPDLICLPLYGNMVFDEQMKVFKPTRERKVIVATNIAETSITIDGVVYVIDMGFEKRTGFHPETGIQSLDLSPISKASAAQRAGRAGRTQPGMCYRLYPENDFNSREEYTVPEIQRTDLAGVVLQMKSLGITDIENFDFIDPPDRESFEAAYKTLVILGALDKGNGLTSVGRLMAKLPLEPRIGRMLVAAQEYGCVDEVCIIAASLSSIRSVFARPKDKQFEADQAHKVFKDKTSDFLTLLSVYDAYERFGCDEQWCYQHFLNNRVLCEIRNVKNQLKDILSRAGISGSTKDPEKISKAVATGLVENIFQNLGHHAFGGSDGKFVYIHPGSVLFGEYALWMVAASIVETTKTFTRNCAVIEPSWIAEIAPQLCNTRTEANYSNQREGKIEAIKHIYFRDTEIKAESIWITVDEFKKIQEKKIVKAEAKGWLRLVFTKEPEKQSWENRNRWIAKVGDAVYEDDSYSSEPTRGRQYYCSPGHEFLGRIKVHREFEVMKFN
ncbi:MAG: ATP-dependent RNA helicase dhx8 [Parcubacteria group bacterium GW2011_GWF2_43_11]|nr:MAG: ATP-dependent RNA helicase dhx8 [Parcubacteria group bacterium GW2011_GWF2_43_11]